MKNIFTKVWLAGFVVYFAMAAYNAIHMVQMFVKSGIEFSIRNYVLFTAQANTSTFIGIMIFVGVFFIVSMFFILHDYSSEEESC